jgi:hypothetical protein
MRCACGSGNALWTWPWLDEMQADGVSLDMWTDTATYTMLLSNLIVAPYP